jgi:hypothetical protein
MILFLLYASFNSAQILLIHFLSIDSFLLLENGLKFTPIFFFCSEQTSGIVFKTRPPIKIEDIHSGITSCHCLAVLKTF